MVVGVVGGLLSSRLLQRNFDHRRHEEQRNQLTLRKIVLDKAIGTEQELIKVHDAAEWVSGCAQTLLEHPSAVVLPKLRQFFPCRRDTNEFSNHITVAIKLAGDQAVELQSMVAAAAVLPADWRMLDDAAGFETPTPVHEAIFKAAWTRATAIKAGEPPPTDAGADPHADRPSAAAREAFRRLEMSERELALIETELKVVQGSMDADETTTGVRAEVWALLGLGLVGVVIPTGVLAVGPTSLWGPWRGLLVFAMAVSFLFVTGFLGAAQRLEREARSRTGIVVDAFGFKWPRDPKERKRRMQARYGAVHDDPREVTPAAGTDDVS